MSAIARAAVSAPGRVASATGIAQDNIIFAMLLFAFVIWIVTKGELATYIAFFKPNFQGPPTTNIVATPSTGASTPSAAVNNAVGSVNTAINATGVGSAITAITGTNPLTLQATPGGVANKIWSWFTGGTNAAPK